jgi:hypothetical protein
MSAAPGQKPGVESPPWASQSAVAKHVPAPRPGTLHASPPEPDDPLEPLLDPPPKSKPVQHSMFAAPGQKPAVELPP